MLCGAVKLYCLHVTLSGRCFVRMEAVRIELRVALRSIALTLMAKGNPVYGLNFSNLSVCCVSDSVPDPVLCCVVC